MPETWKSREGQAVNGKFPLLQYLGSGEQTAVFLTEYQEGEQPVRAVIKLVPDAGSPEDELQLSRWQLAAELSHPHLIKLLDIGRCELGGLPLLYVVMECAEENVGQVLPHRALTAVETAEMLGPVLDALAYLHGKGFVHGHITPGNIMADGDQLKLSSDTVLRAGEPANAGRKADAYAPPENIPGAIPVLPPASPARDIWSLGMSVVETLTQNLPDARAAQQQKTITFGELPEPFLDIVRHCLVWHPQGRWSAAQIAARLHGQVPNAVAHVAPVAAAEAVTARNVQKPTPKPAEKPIAPQRPVSEEGSSREIRAAVSDVRRPITEIRTPPRQAQSVTRMQKQKQFAYRPSYALSAAGALAGLVILAVIVFVSLRRPDGQGFKAHGPDSVIASNASASNPIPQQHAVGPLQAHKPSSHQAAPQASAHVAASQRRSGAAADHFSAEAPLAASARAESAEPESANPIAKLPSGAVVQGSIAHQTLPDVSQGARNTIRGTVRVKVKVDVDPAGNVENAELNSSPSKYFGRAAVEAAQRWKFKPPKVAGRSVLSNWTLQFNFTRDETTVVPTQDVP